MIRIKGFRHTDASRAYETGAEGSYTVRQGKVRFRITATVRLASPLNAAWAARLERLLHDLAALKEAGDHTPEAERLMSVQAFADTLLVAFSWDLTDEDGTPHECSVENFVAVMAIEEFYLGAFVPMSRDAADRGRYYEAAEEAAAKN